MSARDPIVDELEYGRKGTTVTATGTETISRRDHPPPTGLDPKVRSDPQMPELLHQLDGCVDTGVCEDRVTPSKVDPVVEKVILKVCGGSKDRTHAH